MPMTVPKLLLLNVLGGGAAISSPLDIPGLALWLDASDASTLFQDSAGTTPATADNDVVGYWGDKSGNGRHVTQATTANKPLLKLAQQNGRNVVRFDGSNDYLAAIFGTTITQPITALAIYKPTPDGDRFAMDGITAGNRVAMLGVTVDIRLYAGADLNSGVAPLGLTIAQTGVFNGASSIVRINGAEKAVGNVGSGSLTGITIGARYSVNPALNGHISELLLYTGALSTPNIEALEAYLNAKWGVY